MKDKKEKYNPEVTMDDVNDLGDRIINQKEDGQGDDSQLQNRVHDVDFTGKDLDVPGRDLPKNRTAQQLKDEENQLYSQGSGHNDHLEDAENHSK
ncbi:hypothetical protein Q2T40_10625 [Winogradskyella maritima]|uniref:Uncharacterized protein n=1 Tax=Winogradskyella maritima TaxID=1517766 RepID=A0ABV8AJ65_9FLAO|nr:hypothetical protein [Winogradskyella maritima]